MQLIQYKTKISILFLIAANLLTSCKKYLDKNPDSSVAVPTSLADLQALLDNSQIMNIRNTPSFGDCSADDYFLTDNAYNSYTKAGQTIYTWNRTAYNFQNDWSIAYQPVYVSNYCLDGLDKIPLTAPDQTKWNKVKGSALFYRSYNFLNLLWEYAKAYDKSTASSDLGIVLRLSSDFNIPSKRATVQDCYDQIIMDTKTAVDCLPEIPEHVMQPSKPAAYGLLARVYLTMREYDSSLKYSNLCLQSKNSLIDFNGDVDIPNSINDPNPFNRFNKETIFYSEMNTVNAINNPDPALVDTLLYASYDPHDLRKAAYFLPNSGYYQFKGNYTAQNYVFFSGIATDEMYLTRAESFARTGRVNEAMNDLNTLMEKRWDNTVPYPVITATDSADAVSKILDNRRKELLTRGTRWIDIKRLNKEGRNIILTRLVDGQTYTLLPNDKYYALPLPADIVSITGILQN